MKSTEYGWTAIVPWHADATSNGSYDQFRNLVEQINEAMGG